MTAIVIPSLGGRVLTHCLDAVTSLDPPPRRTLVVLSGGAAPPVKSEMVDFLVIGPRLGFCAAVNAGIDHLDDSIETVALLNDDAVPSPGWLAPLEAALEADSSLAAVQGTVTDAVGASVDGRGIALDATGLPIQIDHGSSPAPEPCEPKSILAVSGTASVYRVQALRRVALGGGEIFDSRFGSYHEDLDLGLRLRRLGWNAAWVPNARVGHVGSMTGHRLNWRHPWWVLINRWRAFAGNLTAAAIIAALPTLFRGELRAVATLSRSNPRAVPISAAVLASLPWVVVSALRRPSPGPRLKALPEIG